MIRAPTTKISVEKDFRFSPFNEMFMNHIKNMSWFTSLVFIKSGIDYNIGRYFVQLRLEAIETEYQTLEISTIPTDNIKKIKFRGLYTWIFNSSNKSTHDFFATERNNHHLSGTLASKLLNTNILRGV